MIAHPPLATVCLQPPDLCIVSAAPMGMFILSMNYSLEESLSPTHFLKVPLGRWLLAPSVVLLILHHHLHGFSRRCWVHMLTRNGAGSRNTPANNLSRTVSTFCLGKAWPRAKAMSPYNTLESQPRESSTVTCPLEHASVSKTAAHTITSPV